MESAVVQKNCGNLKIKNELLAYDLFIVNNMLCTTIESVSVKFSIVVTFVLLSTLTTSALADDACKIFNDVGDEYALGQLLMETDAQMLIATKGMTTKQHDDCFSNSDDCFFTYKDGIEYVISRYYKDDTLTTIAQEVVQVARANGSYAGPLIAGIHWGDTVEAVRKKLGTLPQNFPEWTFTDRRYEAGEGSKFLLSTGPCIRSTNGALWSYTLSFDWLGHLTGVEVWAKDYRPST